MRHSVLVCLLSVAWPTFAGVEDLVKHLASDGLTNVNKAAIVRDQHANFLTGGSIIQRGSRPKTLQPLTIQTPKFAFDACTGSADFRFGGLSYVASREFTQFFKNMATASGAYAAKMLIKSACPQCEDIMSYLESVARDINGLMMEQCSLGQMIGKGIYNSLTSSNQQQCLMQDSVGKVSRDMFEATDKCKNDPDRHGEKGKDDELKSLLGNKFNLVWKAVNTKQTTDIALQELMMSVSGTIIGEKVDNSFKFVHKPSLVTSKNLLEEYIGIERKSAKISLYQCDTKNHCLQPEVVANVLAEKDTLYGNIVRILESLIPKVLNNKSKLIDEEEALITFSSIPLLPLIEMELAQKARSEDLLVRMHEFIEVLCYDVITNFLSQILTQATTAVKTLEYAQTDSSVMKDFAEETSKVRKFLSEAKFMAFKRLQVVSEYKERLRQQQRHFKADFGKFLAQNGQG